MITITVSPRALTLAQKLVQAYHLTDVLTFSLAKTNVHRLDLDEQGRLSWQFSGDRSLVSNRRHCCQQSSQQVLVVDLDSAKLRYRLRYGGGVSELLARAVGIKHHKMDHPLKVVDATAGLGVDSWMLANLGMEVMMIERSPVMFLLLADGLMRVKTAPPVQQHKLQLLFGDAKQYLAMLAHDYTVLYLDPMYPVTKTSAARNQLLRNVHTLVGSDEDAALLLRTARPLYHRIVVKRPYHAPCLAAMPADWQLMGKSCRYDLYFGETKIQI